MTEAKGDHNERLQEAMKLILKESNERRVRKIIAETLLLPSGTPEHDSLIQIWKECRQSHGWRVSE
jgi:hypothetical protein